MPTTPELIEQLRTEVIGRFDRLEDKVDVGFGKMDERLRAVEIGYARIGEQVEGIDKRLYTVEQKGNRQNRGSGRERLGQIIPIIVKWILIAVVIGGALMSGRVLQALGWLK